MYAFYGSSRRELQTDDIQGIQAKYGSNVGCDGSFSVTNKAVPNFPVWAREAGYQVVAGDFNGDGRSDLALSGAQSATTIPVAFSGC